MRLIGYFTTTTLGGAVFALTFGNGVALLAVPFIELCARTVWFTEEN